MTIEHQKEGPTPEFGSELENATKEGGSVLGRLSRETVAKLREMAADPEKGERLLQYLEGRGQKIDKNNWVILALHWATDLGIPKAVMEAASKRKARKEN